MSTAFPGIGSHCKAVASNHVVAIMADKVIVAQAASDDIPPSAAINQVLPVATEQAVIAIATVDRHAVYGRTLRTSVFAQMGAKFIIACSQVCLDGLDVTHGEGGVRQGKGVDGCVRVDEFLIGGIPHSTGEFIAPECGVVAEGGMVGNSFAVCVKVTTQEKNPVRTLLPEIGITLTGHPRPAAPLGQWEVVGDDLEGIVALAAPDEVAGLTVQPPGQHVVAIPAKNPVFSRPAREDVVTGPAQDDVATGRERIIRERAGQVNAAAAASRQHQAAALTD